MIKTIPIMSYKNLENAKTEFEKGNVNGCFLFLIDYFDNSEINDNRWVEIRQNVILQRSRYNFITKKNLNGTSSSEDYSLEINRLSEAVLHSIEELMSLHYKVTDYKEKSDVKFKLKTEDIILEFEGDLMGLESKTLSDLLNVISKKIEEKKGGKPNIYLNDITDGSIKLHLSISKEDRKILEELIENSELDDLGLKRLFLDHDDREGLTKVQTKALIYKPYLNIKRYNDEFTELSILFKTPRNQDIFIKDLIQFLAITIDLPSSSQIDAELELSPLKEKKKYDKFFPFMGVYRLYTYKSSHNSSYISESLLKIDAFGRAFYSGTHEEIDNFDSSRGKVDLSDNDSLIISLKNQKNQRNSFLFINSIDLMPQNDTYYTGIFSSIGKSKVMLANKVVLKYLGNDMTLFETTPLKKYSMLESELEKVPEEIRISLTGKTNNMIGFIRPSINSSQDIVDELKDEVSLKDVFFDSACHRALTNDVNQIVTAVKMFERAVSFGFKPITALEEELVKYEAEGLIDSKMKEGILNSEIYLNLINSQQDESN